MWTEERCASLRGLWNEGLPARTIGAMLGVSKNAVIGKARRLGVAPRVEREWRATQKKYFDKKGQRKKRKPKQQLHLRVSRPMEIVDDITDAAIPLAQRKTLLDLGNNDCRWPVGDPTRGFWCNEEFFFCGAATTDGSPYCPGHTARGRFNRSSNPKGAHRPANQGGNLLLRGGEQPTGPADCRV